MSINSNRLRLAKLPYHIMLGLSAAALASSPLLAQQTTDSNASMDQEDDESLLEEVTVTGMKGSLMTSQSIREDSDVIVDAVTAMDMSAMPDRSVAEVLQRIPGVAITRFSGSNDPDHFSAEGTSAVVRGLNFIRSELNGRDIFTVDSGQGLGFNAVSPELLGGVAVFKTQSADMIEGGIGGTVDLVTRKPFDAPDEFFAYSLEGNYGTLAEEWSPGVSALYSNNWDLASGGSFGWLISAAYNQIQTRSDGTLVAEWLPRDDAGHIIPAGAGVRTQEFDRKRTGISTAMQWQSADDAHTVTFEFFTTKFDNSWGEYVVEPGIDDGPNISPRPGTEFTFDNNGLFQSGIISFDHGGWTGNDDRFSNYGGKQIAQRRTQDNESKTTDINLNWQWDISDQWSAEFDAQYVKSKVDVYDISVQGAIYTDVFLDMTTDIPQVTYLPPTGFSEGYVQNPYNQWIRSIMDHQTDNDGDETALRADAQYDFEGSGWAQDIRFGARYSDRQQTVLRSTYNWGNVSDTWNNPYFLDDPTLPAGLFVPYGFENFHSDASTGAEGIPIYGGPLDQDSLTLLTQLAGNGGWVPLYERGGVIPGTSYLPGEDNKTKMKTTAFYTRFDFGQELSNGTVLDGNVGLRYVHTEVAANGGIVYPSYDQWLGGQSLEQRCTPQAGGTIPGFCLLPPDEQASYASWADGSSVLIQDDYSYNNWLPSLNLRWGFHGDMALRFAYSQAISRPDFGLLKSNFEIDFGEDNPLTGAWLGPDADTAQVRIDPVKANQFDLAWEWYFADVGSITITGFYKKLSNYIVPGVVDREFTNNGESWDVQVTGSTNSDSSDGKIQGVEFAYQQVFDTLPGLWSGLGLAANYTYIDTDGVPNVTAINTEDDGVGSPPNIDVSGLGLPGLSKDTANVVLFWETDKISTRLAYNYRSDYTLTTRDVIYPFTPIVQASTGTLDASFFYTFNQHFILGVQMTNLNNEVTETRSVYNQDLNEAGRSYFSNDTRWAVVLRGTF